MFENALWETGDEIDSCSSVSSHSQEEEKEKKRNEKKKNLRDGKMSRQLRVSGSGPRRRTNG